MAVYNGEKYLAEAIDSILGQTFRDFEFIIVDDGSTDRTIELLTSFATRDERIRIIANEKNIGLAESLNSAIEIAQGELIARMDADDISLPDRFEKQVEFLSNHSTVRIIGGSLIQIDELGNKQGRLVPPSSSSLIRWNMLLGNGIIASHPSVMMDKDFIQDLGGYGDFRAAQDFELWSRTFDMDPFPITNLEDNLLYYRHHLQMNTKQLSRVQENIAITTRLKTIERLIGILVSQEVVLSYRHTRKDYSNIVFDMQIWIEIYRQFVQRFRPIDSDMKSIDREFFQRLGHYIFLNPFTKNSSGRVHLWKVRKLLPANFVWRLLFFKLTSLIRRFHSLNDSDL